MKRKLFSVTMSLLILTTSAFGAVELTNQEKDFSIRNVKAKNGIVASASPLASKIGLTILERGGNAVDAAVATAFTLGLTEPDASGPGGGGYMLTNINGKQLAYDYEEHAPEAITYDLWHKIKKNKTYFKNGNGFVVPGFVAGMLEALEKQGTMTIAEVLQPVIEVAENGFEVTPTLADIISLEYEKIEGNDNAAKVFLNEGLPYTAGEVIKNPDYAEMLKRIVKNGRDGFYKGETAKAIINASNLITQKDLDNYKPKILTPISTDYRGYKVMTMPPESCGVAVLEILNIVENYDLKKMGVNDPKLFYLWGEAMNLAHIDRYTYVGDTAFEDVPTEVLISQEYADMRKGQINMKKAAGRIPAGYITKGTNKNIGTWTFETPSTTHVSIIDKDGNAVSMTNTLGHFFGSGDVPEGTGMVMNSHFTNFSYASDYPVNSVKPGKTPRSTMSPTMVFDKKGSLKLVVGSPGGARILSTVPYVISNVIDQEMDIQDAINFPRVHKVHGKFYLEGGLSPKVTKYLESKDEQLTKKGKTDLYFGGVQAIEVMEDGTYEGGADPRRDGKALGY